MNVQIREEEGEQWPIKMSNPVQNLKLSKLQHLTSIMDYGLFCQNSEFKEILFKTVILYTSLRSYCRASEFSYILMTAAVRLKVCICFLQATVIIWSFYKNPLRLRKRIFHNICISNFPVERMIALPNCQCSERV